MRKIFTRLILISFTICHSVFLSAHGEMEIPRDEGYSDTRGESINSELSGTYTIGGENPDFPTFKAAIEALEVGGVSGAVLFKVRPGTYTEQLEIDLIPGSSCSNRIVFEGEGGAPAEAILQSPEGSAYTILINGADGIYFRNLSLVRDVEVWPGSDCFRLEDNILFGTVHSLSSASARNNYHHYKDNVFQSGDILIENEAPWNPADPIFDEGLIIDGNEFRGYGTISVEGQKNFIISNNILPELSQESVGITVSNSWYGKEISGNTIMVTTGNYKGTAMVLNSAAAARITENFISLLDGGFAMDITTGKSLEDEILIANNFIYVSGHDARGIYYFPISNLVGLDISNPYHNRINLYHNTIRIAGYSEYVPNYALSLSGGHMEYYILNNVIANYANGSLIKQEGSNLIAEMDYNNLVPSYGSHGPHSISVNPGSPTNPAQEMVGAGIYLEEVPEDYYGQARNNPPTIGAVEREVIKKPLSGTYTIGGENPDYATFSDAIAALEGSGVADNILFKVRPGTYYEQLNISFSPAQEAKVIFEGESGDSTDVVIRYPLDQTLVIEDSKNLTFRYLTFASGIQAQNSSNLLFESNIIEGGVNAFVVSRDTYRNNLFLESGIEKYGDGHEEQGGNHFFNTDKVLFIENNTFNVSGSAISLYAQEDITITGNAITIKSEGEDTSGPIAIHVRESEHIKEINNNSIVSQIQNTMGMSFGGGFFSGSLPQELTNNSIELLNGGTGISFYYPGASSGAALVANNMISINAGSSSTGIAVSFTPGIINLFHNSIYLYGEDSNSRVVYFGDEIYDDLNLKNNIFANLAGGTVFTGEYFQDSPDKIATSDYNDLYSSGGPLAQWQIGTIANLSEWQSVTGFDASSVSVDPEFESEGNLIPNNAALDEAGIALAEVTMDYYGQFRNNPPDIGAVEFEVVTDPEVPVAPQPTTGFVVGGGWIHSPKGAITDNPNFEGKAILSFHAHQKKSDVRPKGIVTFTIPRTDIRFRSKDGFEWIAVNDNTVILQGTGQLNREDGYHFVISAVDNGNGSGAQEDTYRIMIWNPEGELVYDNQRGSEMYAIATMPIGGGNIQIMEELQANARMNAAPQAADISQFRAYPTRLEQDELWIEIPKQGLTEQLQLSILNSQGRVMTESTISTEGKQSLNLNTRGWHSGVYLLIIQGEGTLYQQKLVK